MNRSEQASPAPRVFADVPDIDLVTLADRTYGSLEFYSTLTALKLMAEVEHRGIEAAVIARRAYTLRLRDNELTPEDAGRIAGQQISLFRNENFPWVASDASSDDVAQAAAAWNGYIQF
jgi:hypothetical protein